jgi:hypothetical protein
MTHARLRNNRRTIRRPSSLPSWRMITASAIRDLKREDKLAQVAALKTTLSKIERRIERRIERCYGILTSPNICTTITAAPAVDTVSRICPKRWATTTFRAIERSPRIAITSYLRLSLPGVQRPGRPPQFNWPDDSPRVGEKTYNAAGASLYQAITRLVARGLIRRLPGPRESPPADGAWDHRSRTRRKGVRSKARPRWVQNWCFLPLPSRTAIATHVLQGKAQHQNRIDFR